LYRQQKNCLSVGEDEFAHKTFASSGEAPLKLKHFASECSMETANSPIFSEIWKRKRPSNIV